MCDAYRLKEVADAYTAYKLQNPLTEGTCALCLKDTSQTFTHWRIVDNTFPYDVIASRHEMLVPIRHVTEDSLTAEEIRDLSDIKKKYLGRYDFIMEASVKTKTIPEHFHLHLIVAKDTIGTTS